MSELLVVTGQAELIDEILHNPHGIDEGYTRRDGVVEEYNYRSGWYFGAGNPEFWHYAKQLVVPSGEVLDIGMQTARSSFFFATQGMHVTGIDTSKYAVDMVNEATESVAESFALDITPTVGDALEVDLGENTYDIVLLDHTLHHFPSKALAVALIEKAYKAVKPNGHMWVRALGKADSYYEDLRRMAQWGETEIIDDDVVRHPCQCSGEYGFDPSLFFGQTELLERFAHLGARIVHSQLMPQLHRKNVMYGEDFNRNYATDLNGVVTILAQKV